MIKVTYQNFTDNFSSKIVDTKKGKRTCRFLQGFELTILRLLDRFIYPLNIRAILRKNLLF